MRGLVLLGDQNLELRDFPIPTPGYGQAVVKIKTAAICGSDVHFYNSHPEIFENLGGISGHEPAGIVYSVGEGVTNVKVGDRVCLYHFEGCGECEYCKAGHYNNCKKRKGLGWLLDGSNAEYLMMNAENCLLLPDELSFEDGSFIACVAATCYSALKKLSVSGRDTLVVYGLGPVGLTAVLMAKAMGARVIGVSRNEYRNNLAMKIGADIVINNEKEDVYERIMELTGGHGADKSLETSGSNVLRKMTVKAAAIYGQVCLVGNSEDVMNNNIELLAHFDQRFIIRKELTIMGSYVMPLGMYEELKRFLLQNKIHLDSIVTHHFTLDQAEEAFALAESGQCGKVIFTFDD